MTVSEELGREINLLVKVISEPKLIQREGTLSGVLANGSLKTIETTTEPPKQNNCDL